MKRKEDIVETEVTVEETPVAAEKEEKNVKEEIENTDLQVVNNKIVDKDGFAVTGDKITDESEKSELFVKVDTLRQQYLKSARIIKYTSWGIMIPLLAGALAAVFSLNKEGLEDWVKYLVIGILAAVAVGLIVFKILTKRYLDNKASNYVSNYYTVTTQYMFQGDEFSQISGPSVVEILLHSNTMIENTAL